MSTVDDKTKKVSEDNRQEEKPAGPVILFFIVGLVASLIVGWVVFPKLLYSKKKQPINFNHALHVEEVDNGCDSCHSFREDGTFSGIPKIASCKGCHEEVLGTNEEEALFVDEYIAKNREVDWLVYSKQPACVFFSHVAHVKMGNIKCVTCHGPIGESTESRIYEENRITGYSRDIWGKNIGGFKKNTWDRMKMDDCADCHAEKREGVLRTELENPVQSLLSETVSMIFPKKVKKTRGTSVQTERDGCLVCHK
mgnify:CR=1 FL=1